MLKFVKHNLEQIDNVEVYPIFSLLVFFIFFVVLFYKVFRANKDFIAEMKDLPLDNNQETN